MPYIKPESREQLDEQIRDLASQLMAADNGALAGELNYAITSLLLKTYYGIHRELRYHHINEIIGILECAKMEFYRRQAAPYEDVKAQENGDVY